MNKILVLADGEPMPRKQLQQLRTKRFLLALDGAAEQTRRCRWHPDLILGDFDTVTTATLRFYERQGVEILPAADQNHTDLEKALAWCALRDFTSIWVAQALGNRLDHSLTNLSLLKRFHNSQRELLFFTPIERVRFVKNQKLILRGPAKRLLAVMPFPKCTVKSRGLAYEMNHLPLELGVRESVSNQALKAEALLEIEGEALVVEGLRSL